MIKRILSVCCLSLLLWHAAYAQPHFLQTYPSALNSYANTALQAQDNSGYYMAGSALQTGLSVRIVKAGKQGAFIWEKQYNGIGDIYDMVPMSNGNYLATGPTTFPLAQDSSKVLLLQFDPAGDTVWTKQISAGANAWGHAIKATTDGGFIIAGTVDQSANSRDVLVIKTDANGNIEWLESYSHPAEETARDIVETPDGAFIVAGESYDGTDRQLLAMKIDSSGAEIWTYLFGGSGREVGNAAAISKDDQYLLAGYTSSIGNGNEDMYLIKLNENGDLQWEQAYGGPGSETAYDMDVGYFGEILLAGAFPSSQGLSDVIGMVATNESGDSLWTKTYLPENTNDAQALSVLAMGDEGWLMACQTTNDQFITEFTMLRTNAQGDTGWVSGLSDQVVFNDQISIYPHPVLDQAQIRLQLPVGQNAKMFIRDLAGRRVRMYNLQPQQTTLNFKKGDLSAGLSLLQVEDGERLWSCKLLLL